MTKRWARKTLLAVLVIQFAYAMHSAAGLSHTRHPVDFWVGVIVISAAIYGWQAFVLLTENPDNWPVREQVKKHERS